MKQLSVLLRVLGIVLLFSSGPATGQSEANLSAATETAPALEWSPDSGVLQSLESLQRALALKEAEAAELQQ